MKKTVAALAASAILGAGAAVSIQPVASADQGSDRAGQLTQVERKNGKCVTKREYRRIRKGMSPRQVKRITGTWGKVDSTYSGSGYRTLTRSYKPCRPFNKYGFVTITFDNRDGRWNRTPLSVDSKYAFWLHN